MLPGKVRGLELLQQQTHMTNRAMMGSSERDSEMTAGMMSDADLARLARIDPSVDEAVDNNETCKGSQALSLSTEFDAHAQLQGSCMLIVMTELGAVS